MKGDEGWWRVMKGDEGWMMKDDDFKLLRGWGVAFETEKLQACQGIYGKFLSFFFNEVFP